MQVKLLMVSNNSLYREGVSVILNEMYPKCSVLHTMTTSCVEEQAGQSLLDLILLDKGSSTGDTWEDTLIKLNETSPSIPVCLLADAQSSPRQVREAYELGVKGCLYPDSSKGEIKNIIHQAISGNVTFPDRLWELEIRTNSSLLTARQLEIMEYIEKGKSNKAIAETLNLSVATIKRHVSNIFRVLEVKNRVEAINTFKS